MFVFSMEVYLHMPSACRDKRKQELCIIVKLKQYSSMVCFISCTMSDHVYQSKLNNISLI